MATTKCAGHRESFESNKCSNSSVGDRTCACEGEKCNEGDIEAFIKNALDKLKCEEILSILRVVKHCALFVRGLGGNTATSFSVSASVQIATAVAVTLAHYNIVRRFVAIAHNN